MGHNRYALRPARGYVRVELDEGLLRCVVARELVR
jgi:hypothetical protein